MTSISSFLSQPSRQPALKFGQCPPDRTQAGLVHDAIRSHYQYQEAERLIARSSQNAMSFVTAPNIKALTHKVPAWRKPWRKLKAWNQFYWEVNRDWAKIDNSPSRVKIFATLWPTEQDAQKEQHQRDNFFSSSVTFRQGKLVVSVEEEAKKRRNAPTPAPIIINYSPPQSPIPSTIPKRSPI